jgi:hypothetical protein
MHNCDVLSVGHKRELSVNSFLRRVLFSGRHKPDAPALRTADGGAATKRALVAGYLGDPSGLARP